MAVSRFQRAPNSSCGSLGSLASVAQDLLLCSSFNTPGLHMSHVNNFLPNVPFPNECAHDKVQLVHDATDYKAT